MVLLDGDQMSVTLTGQFVGNESSFAHEGQVMCTFDEEVRFCREVSEA